MPSPMISEQDASMTWAALASDRKTVLIDVRTQAEWSFVGVPDLTEIGGTPAFIEWQSAPTMEVNQGFLNAVADVIEASEADEVYFICRSGVRSLHAAMVVAEMASARGREITCVNVIAGFEGDPDRDGRRGRLNGWIAAGLPWRQA